MDDGDNIGEDEKMRRTNAQKQRDDGIPLEPPPSYDASSIMKGIEHSSAAHQPPPPPDRSSNEDIVNPPSIVRDKGHVGNKSDSNALDLLEVGNFDMDDYDGYSQTITLLLTLHPIGRASW